MASSKRCLYEILGLNRDCSPEEIRSAYRKLALQRHPDKLIQTGILESQATAAFQELVNAYEVLSDPRERSWYDSHRSQILFSDPSSSSSSSLSPVPDLFSFFSNSVFSGFGDTGKGFYKVYGDLFGKIYGQELLFAKKMGLGEDSVRVAPLMGKIDSDYTQVTAFYAFWLGFSTVMDFGWVDEYDVMAGVNRKSRRQMEEENNKLRKKAKREYNETVRDLAGFVKKRDKRVIEMQMKRTLEQEKKKEEEKARKKEAQRLKLERARLYEEPEWAKIEDDDQGFENEEDNENDNNKKNELYCVVCSKKFKSDKQWKNHEKSKKHRDKVAELRSMFDSEEEEEEEAVDVKEEVAGDAGESHLDELRERFEDSINFDEETQNCSIRDEEETEVSKDNVQEGSDDVEIGILKTMMSGHKSRKKQQSKSSYYNESQVDIENEEIDLMEYNNRRSTRRNRAAKREAVKKSGGEALRVEAVEVTEDVLSNSNHTEDRGLVENLPVGPHLQDSSSRSIEEAGPNSNTNAGPKGKTEAGPNCKRDPLLENNKKVVNQRSDKKDTGKRDTNANAKNTSKGKKQKGQGTSKSTVLSCETCGEDFNSRNKLHQHLGDTGHASLKSRR